MRMTARRWSDNDRYLGPFTYAKDTSYKSWAVILSSGDDEYRGCQLRFSGFGRTLIIALPPIIKPWLEEFGEPVTPDMAARIGRNRYYHMYQREFGFSLSASGRGAAADYLSIKYGAQTHDSRTDMNKGYFLPWVSWRHVRHSLYDLDGNLYAHIPESHRTLGLFEERKAIEDGCPSLTFAFIDFDGEPLTAKTRIEEREWRLGESWFKWLSMFRKPMIRRSLVIEFSGETGDRKGSWKGGTTGTSIDMLPSELHASAFRRYCDGHEMTFIGVG